MPITVRSGDLFTSKAHTLVNPVNCAGVMGAGLARQFKMRYPGMYARYRTLCQQDVMTPGAVMFDDGEGQRIANMATKDHWRDDSQLEWIDGGLKILARDIVEESVPSLAIPPVGCGLGGLDLHDVLPLMVRHLAPLDCRVLVYVPPTDVPWAKSVVEAG